MFKILFSFKGLTEVTVKTVAEIDSVMTTGASNRTVGSTKMNEHSSRSHSIFTISVEGSELINGKEVVRQGKLNLVDLAGSENQKKTGAEVMHALRLFDREGGAVRASYTY